MKQEKYDLAASAYKKSSEFKFRLFTNEEAKRRDLLTKYCLAKAGLLFGEDLGDMSEIDILETKNISYLKPFDFPTLAFYYN